FDHLDGGTGRAAVVAPALGLESRRELVVRFLGYEMKYLHAVDQLPGQRDAVRRDDGGVIPPRLAGRQRSLLDVRFARLSGCSGSRLIRIRRFGSAGFAEAVQNSRGPR